MRACAYLKVCMNGSGVCVRGRNCGRSVLLITTSPVCCQAIHTKGHRVRQTPQSLTMLCVLCVFLTHRCTHQATMQWMCTKSTQSKTHTHSYPLLSSLSHHASVCCVCCSHTDARPKLRCSGCARAPEAHRAWQTHKSLTHATCAMLFSHTDARPRLRCSGCARAPKAHRAWQRNRTAANPSHR